MSFAYLTTFLRRATVVPIFASIVLTLSVPIAWGAASPTKITIHIPGKTLAVMVFYFGKDKGFFSQEGIDAQLVAMAPPIAIAAMVAGLENSEMDFGSGRGGGTPSRKRAHASNSIARTCSSSPIARSAEARATRTSTCRSPSAARSSRSVARNQRAATAGARVAAASPASSRC